MTEPADEPELSPPGLTPSIWELTCDNDPNWELRTDCVDRQAPDGHTTVIRGGFGGYFHLGSSGGGHASGGG
jgi:hypothetical protein